MDRSSVRLWLPTEMKFAFHHPIFMLKKASTLVINTFYWICTGYLTCHVHNRLLDWYKFRRDNFTSPQTSPVALRDFISNFLG